MNGPYIFQYLKSESAKPFRKFLSEKRYSSKELGESYRVINHWTDLGLLSEDRSNVAQWRKFSIVDIVWTLVIRELRVYGMPLNTIKQARENLFEIPYASDWPEHELEFHIFLTMIKRSVFLLVFENGFAVLISDQDMVLQEVLNQGKKNSMLVISINKLMSQIFPDKDFKPYFPLLKELTQDEFELISFIRFNVFDEVIVKLSNGKLQRFEGKKNESLELNLLDIIKKHQYQRIEVVVAGNNVVKITQTVQEKPSAHGIKPAN